MKRGIIYSLSILMVLLPAFVFCQAPAYVPKDGLAAWWSFEGNADDASANMNHGQVSGATLTTDRFGIPDRAYFFDGVNDYIRINDAPSLQIKDEITISAWFSVSKWYTNPLWGDLHFPVLCKSASNNKYALYNLTVMPKTVLAYLKGKGGKRTGLTTTLNEWMHIVITVSEGFIIFYVNGVFTGRQVVTNEIGVLSGVVESDPLFLGNNISGQTEWAHGKLDDIGIWNRALTPQEIKNLYYGDIVCLHPDYDGLMSLYYATGGQGWKNNEGWKTGAEASNCDPCSQKWFGVTCENGRVSEIQLEDNQLKGNLPDFSLSNITKFNCANNQLSGSIPPFSAIPNLQHFDCSNNQLTGPIPESSFMQRFTTFNCADNRLTGNIPAFTNQEFIEFNCSNNLLTGDIPELDILSSECRINLRNNALSGSLPGIINYPRLTFIDFSNNRLAGCIPPFYCDILSGPGSLNLSGNGMLPYQGDINTFCQDLNSENAPCDDGLPFTSGDIIQPDCHCLGISTDSDIVSLDIDNRVCGISGKETQVPVRVFQYRDIAEISFSIISSDNAIAEISGVAGIHPLSGLAPSDFKLDNQTLSLMYSGVLHSLPDSAVLFNVRIKLAGGAGSKANITFKEQVTVKKENQQDVEVLTASGSVCIAQNASVIACAANAQIPGAPLVGDECGLIVQPSGPEKGGTYTGCGGTITYTWTYLDCQTDEVNWTYTYFLSDPKTSVTCTQRTEICFGEVFSPFIQYEISCNKTASITYEISGTTVRNGTGSDASGAFNVGSSLIRWKVETPCDTAYCETEVSVLPRILSDTSVIVCDSFTWNGNTYTQSGEYTFTRTNSSGCDDLERLNLTVGKRVSPTLYITACESYLWNDSLYSASGVYTNSIVNSSGCDSISILDLTIILSPCDEILQPILNIENDVCGGPGDIVCVPVRVFKYSGIAAFQLGIISLDTTIAEIMGICQVHPDLESASFDHAVVDNSLQIIYADLESSLPDSSILFSLEVKLKSTPGSAVRLFFQDSIRAQGYDFDVVRILGVSGSVCITQKSSFVSGQIINPALKGIPNAEVRAFPDSKVINTSQEGYYVIDPLTNGMTYRITPSFREPILKGVDVADLLIMKRHLLGISSLLSPFAFVAADLNFNRSVELGDLLYLQRLLSGIVDTLPGNVNSWRFIPADFNFLSAVNPLPDIIPDHILISPLINNQENQDFIGVKYGDLNNSVALNAYDWSETNARGVPEPALMISAAEGSAGAEIWIDLTSKDFTGGAVMQFSLAWPADKLALVSVPDDKEEIRIEGTTIIDKRFIDRGLLSFIWESDDVLDGTTLPENTICYRLKFRILDTQACVANIGSSAEIRSPKFVNSNLEEFNLAVETGKVTIAGSSAVEHDHTALGVYPNPTTGILHLEYGNHTPQTVTLQTMEGVALKKISGTEKTMDLSDLTAGVYMVKMQFGHGIASRKVIVIK